MAGMLRDAVGALSPWHWAAMAAFVAGGSAVALLAVKTARRAPGAAPGPVSGIGGWLFLLAVGQCLAPLRLAFKLAAEFHHYARALARPDSVVLAAGELVLFFAVLGFQLYVTIALLRRWRAFPRLFLWQWLVMLAWPAADLAWVQALTGVPLARLVAAVEPARAAVPVMLSGAWVWYVFASVRVRNTFTRDRRPRRSAPLTA